MARPSADEYAPYYAKYVALVPEEKVIPVLKTSLAELLALLREVSEEEACRLHPPHTWTIKQVIGHLTDCERVFGYRALRFARGDATPLPGFDENVFAQSAVFRDCPLSSLAAEFEMVRNSHVAFFDNLARDDWDKRGNANGVDVSVRALAFIIAGHQRHHSEIIKNRLAKG